MPTSTKTLSKLDIGGYNPDESQSKWPCGSIFANEGQELYDLVRTHKPKTIIEVGTRWGCSTQWLATACRDNGRGKVITYDIENCHQEWPEDLLPFIEFRHTNVFDDVPMTCDMLFEDGAHTHGFTKQVLKEIKAPVVVVHDFEHWDCVETVKQEAIGVLGKPDEVFFEKPSDCGLAIWFVK